MNQQPALFDAPAPVETVEAPRRISCNGDRANALEMLATLRTAVPA